MRCSKEGSLKYKIYIAIYYFYYITFFSLKYLNEKTGLWDVAVLNVNDDHNVIKTHMCCVAVGWLVRYIYVQ